AAWRGHGRLCWRYKGNAQRAVREGDYKFLKMLDNTFLFNVAADPMERANLKTRRKDIYDRLEAEWYDWNATMLPEVDESNTGNLTGDRTPDRPGAVNSGRKADNPTAPAKTPAPKPKG